MKRMMRPSGLEKLRASYMPAVVRLLFIGESPPASGRFFYSRNSGLYRAMREAFQVACPSVSPSITDENFLAVFQACGCYLIDLCVEPVDHLDRQNRRTVCQAGQAPLARQIAKLQPKSIATLLRSIERDVTAAALRANWRGSFLHLPYPGRWSKHRLAFVEALAPVIQPLLAASGPATSRRANSRPRRYPPPGEP